jgi:hypothetical protein
MVCTASDCPIIRRCGEKCPTGGRWLVLPVKRSTWGRDYRKERIVTATSSTLKTKLIASAVAAAAGAPALLFLGAATAQAKGPDLSVAWDPWVPGVGLTAHITNNTFADLPQCSYTRHAGPEPTVAGVAYIRVAAVRATVERQLQLADHDLRPADPGPGDRHEVVRDGGLRFSLREPFPAHLLSAPRAHRQG